MKINTILFISLSNLGDIILTTPVIEKLRDLYPEAKIDVVTGAPGKKIFVLHPSVRDVHVLQDHRALGRRIRKLVCFHRMKYDLVVDLKGSLLPYLAGAGMSVGGFFDKGPVVPKPDLHKRSEHLSVLGKLTDTPYSFPRFFMPVTRLEKKEAQMILSGAGDVRKVLINPGAKSRLKRWPADLYARLCDELVRNQGCAVIVAGADEDRKTVDDMRGNCTEGFTDLCGKISVGCLAELMKGSDLVVTNDSAPLHIASAVDAPTVAIFGPTDERKYGPLSRKSRVVRPGVLCRPCNRSLCTDGTDKGCLPGLRVEEVLVACREILEDRS
ncbi:MAG: hypothetical protein GF408_05545 [Candidatus Omnitrophica bacterium]|nr:hypothetical protein [Candidatus Omnitrophota bacterium]